MSSGADEERESKAHDSLAVTTREAIEAGRLDEIIAVTGLARATVHACAAGSRLKIGNIVRLRMFFDGELGAPAERP